MNWYLTVLKKYAVFNGRARRKEYWMFFLVNVIISFLLGVIEGLSGMTSGGTQGLVANIYSLAILVPSIAVGVRRMHDVGKTGWFLLIPIYNIVLAAKGGDKGDNKYGDDPKGDVSVESGGE